MYTQLPGTLMTVIDTDYKEYAVLYSCTNSILPRVFHTEYVWILTREGVLSNPSRQNIYTKLDSLKINRNQLHLSDRFGCPTKNVTGPAREEPEVAPLAAVPLPTLIKTPVKPAANAAPSGQSASILSNSVAQSAPSQPIAVHTVVPAQPIAAAQPIVAATLAAVAQPPESDVLKDEAIVISNTHASS